jgi:hypothetical protein
MCGGENAGVALLMASIKIYVYYSPIKRRILGDFNLALHDT